MRVGSEPSLSHGRFLFLCRTVGRTKGRAMMRIERMVFGISGMVIKLRVLKLEVEVERVVHDNFDVAFFVRAKGAYYQFSSFAFDMVGHHVFIVEFISPIMFYSVPFYFKVHYVPNHN